MIAFEVLFLLAVSVVVIATIVSIGRPLAEARAEKLKFKYRDLGSESELILKQRVSALEQDLAELRKQIVSSQETADFAIKMLEKHGVNKAIELKEEK